MNIPVETTGDFINLHAVEKVERKERKMQKIVAVVIEMQVGNHIFIRKAPAQSEADGLAALAEVKEWAADAEIVEWVKVQV